jgi:uncharacterized membrane protein YedE/YeeE
MSTLSSSFRIWALTVSLNAVFFTLIQFGTGDMELAVVSAIICLAGYIIGMPGWLLIWLLMEFIMRFPYSANVRIVWFGCIVSVCVALFYAFMSWTTSRDFSLHDPWLQLLTGTTIAAMIVTLLLDREAFSDAVNSTSIADNE